MLVPSSWSIASILASIVQYIAIMQLTIKILIGIPIQDGSRQKEGPSITSKLILFMGTLCIFCFVMEISVMNRLLGLKGEMCIVPPWWWINPTSILELVIKNRPVHGWASLLDLVQWVGIGGYVLIFLFMKKEYERTMHVYTIFNDRIGFKSP